eukprot:SAG31_NODE_1837_length_7126_cov_8.278497_2_plen_81_part_00
MGVRRPGGADAAAPIQRRGSLPVTKPLPMDSRSVARGTQGTHSALPLRSGSTSGTDLGAFGAGTDQYRFMDRYYVLPTSR